MTARRQICVATGLVLAFARVGAAQQVPADVELLSGVEFGTTGKRPLKMEIVRPKTLPEAAMPVVVFVHGGGWRSGDARGGVKRLTGFAQRGYFCASIEYRLIPEAPFPAQIEDCKCAIRFLRSKAKDYRLDPDRIGVWGSSAGGHLAALLGTSGNVKELEGTGGHAAYSSRVAAVCDWFGPSDLVDFVTASRRGDQAMSALMGGPVEKNRDKLRLASPITHVSNDDPAFLIMQGADDQTVPASQSQKLHEALKKAGVESTLHVFPGEKHGFKGEKFDRMVDEFFDRHLKPAGRGQ
jgi:acetyl esterase/lipase